MTIAAIHLDPRQKQRLARRARRTGSSLSEEVRNAVDLYLSISLAEQEQLKLSVRAANQSMDRTIKKLDETIAYTD